MRPLVTVALVCAIGLPPALAGAASDASNVSNRNVPAPQRDVMPACDFATVAAATPTVKLYQITAVQRQMGRIVRLCNPQQGWSETREAVHANIKSGKARYFVCAYDSADKSRVLMARVETRERLGFARLATERNKHSEDNLSRLPSGCAPDEPDGKG